MVNSSFISALSLVSFIIRPILFLSLLLFGSNLSAQDIRLSVQTGHSGAINKVIFSHDNSYVASCGKDNKISIWDIESGKQYASLSVHSDEVTDIAFNAESTLLYSVSADSTACVWSVKENKLLEKITFDFPIGSLTLDESRGQLIVAGEAVVFLDLNTKNQDKYSLLADNSFTSMEISKSAKWLAVGGKNERVAYVIDLENRIATDRIFASVNDIVFAEDEESFYYASEKGGILNYDFVKHVQSGSTNKSEWNSFNGVDITEDQIIGVTDQAEIVIYNRRNWKKELVIKAHLQMINCVRVGANGQQMVTAGAGRRIMLWDIKSRELIKTLDSEIYRINDIQFSENEDNIVIGFANGFVRQTNLLTNNSISNRLKLSQVQVSKGWKYFLTSIDTLTEDKVRFNMMFIRNSLNNDGTFNFLKDVILDWNVSTNELTIQELNKSSAKIKQYEKDLKYGIKHTETYFLETKLLADSTKDVYVRVDGNIMTINSSGKPRLKIELDHSDRITSVAINSKHGFIATSSWDGLIKFWNISTGEIMSTYGAFGSNDFVYIHPDNYYFASKRALENISFIMNAQLFGFDQFDLMYNRPDLVFSELPYIDEKSVQNYYAAYKKRLSKLGLDENSLELSDNIPLLEVENLSGTTSSNGMLKFSLKADDGVEQLSSLHILANGVPIYGRDGKQLASNSLNLIDSIALTPGKNTIQFFVTNEKGISSLKRQFEVISKQKEATNLYLVTLGCSKFEQSKYDLEFAEKDAKDVYELFTNGKVFDEIYAQTYTDKEVTKKNLKNLDGFFKTAKENDVIIIFVAGHGVLDVNLDYFIATHDMDFNKPQENGIPIGYFENILDQTKSRKKLMFIDACHSGELDKEEVMIDTSAVVLEDDLTFRTVGANVKNLNEVNSFELSKIAFADMRANNGSTVISSSGGDEYSAEGEKWNNGAFTYSMMLGIKNNEADLNKDGRVMLSELQMYLIYSVNKLTEGRQTPTSRVENLINDFRLK